MSTAEGYSLDAYCDFCTAKSQGFGNNRRQALAELRARGWKIGPGDAPSDSIAGGKLARCPIHAKRPTGKVKAD